MKQFGLHRTGFLLKEVQEQQSDNNSHACSDPFYYLPGRVHTGKVTPVPLTIHTCEHHLHPVLFRNCKRTRNVVGEQRDTCLCPTPSPLFCHTTVQKLPKLTFLWQNGGVKHFKTVWNIEVHDPKSCSDLQQAEDTVASFVYVRTTSNS